MQLLLQLEDILLIVILLIGNTVIPVTGNNSKYVKEIEIISAQADLAAMRNIDNGERGVSSSCLNNISIEITKPKEGFLYFFDREIFKIGFTFIIGRITIEVDARIYVDDLNDDFELNLPEEEDYDTIGGFVFSHLGLIPKTGATFDYENLKFTITSAETRRINRIKIQFIHRDSPLER